MIKKDYIAIAKVLNASQNDAVFYNNEPVLTEIKEIADSLSDYFIIDNPNFNKSRFYKAIGI